MSLTKRSPHFDALMEEARRYDELSHERYREYRHFMGLDKQDEKPYISEAVKDREPNNLQ